MSGFNFDSDSFLAKIKLESEEYVNLNQKSIDYDIDDNYQSNDQFDSALVECLDSNEKVKNLILN